ncbi:MAG: hypothetical protein D4R88_02725 [Methanosarcinales archaeon]|nr:MAG: hypothetical protein D4R88_02725 [Methanosarcinales archaeon]
MLEPMTLETLRKKVRETTEKELIKDAIRARKFTGLSTLRQGMELIDFALKARKIRFEND